MYLRKIKNNNKGADVALIGTNYILVLIIIVCAIVDLMVIEYGKMTVVSVIKECELHALAKNFNHDDMFLYQDVQARQDVMQNVKNTFVKSFNVSLAGDNSFMSDCHIVQNGQGLDSSGVFVDFSTTQNSLVITVPQVVFVPKKIFKSISSGSTLPFIGQSMQNMSSTGNLGTQKVHVSSINGSDIIYSGASCKIAFIEQ